MFLIKKLIDNFANGQKSRSTSERFSMASCIKIKPYRYEKSLPRAATLLRTLKGKYSFEIVFSTKSDASIFLLSEDDDFVSLKKRVASIYPEVLLSDCDCNTLYTELGEYCILTAKLKRSSVFPINTNFSVDPFNVLFTSLRGQSITVAYQVAFEPSPKSGEKIISAGEAMMKGKVVGWLNPRIVEATQLEKEVARLVILKGRDVLFRTEMRFGIFDWGEKEKEEVEAITRNVQQYFELFTNSTTNQGFKVKKSESKRALKDFFTRKISRSSLILSAEELSYLAHFPGEEVHAPNIDWLMTRADVSAPTERSIKE